MPEIKFSVAMAKELHPFPSRTRKLSPSAPMVLHGKLCGRVGRRRNPFCPESHRDSGLFYFSGGCFCNIVCCVPRQMKCVFTFKSGMCYGSKGLSLQEVKIQLGEQVGIRGIKTKIAFNVSLLLLASAIISNVLTVVLVQNAWVRNEINQHENFIETIGKLLFLSGNKTDFLETAKQSNPKIIELIKQRSITAFCMTDLNDHVYKQSLSNASNIEDLIPIVDKALKSNQEQKAYADYRRSVYWMHPHTIMMAIPIQDQKKLLGAAGAAFSLTPVYMKIRRYNHPVLIFILLNTSVLTVMGLYRIFRIYLRPIDRIIGQAEKYQENQNDIFTFRREDNELNRLSIALNQMLNRIADDKKKLKEAVTSLESANLELKRAQDEIIRAEKMASIGRLASGIAHEIGNPIGIVLGYIDLLKQSDLDDADKVDFLKRAETEIQRINTVIRQLLDLSRPKESVRQLVAVHAILEDLTEVMRLQPIMKNSTLRFSGNAADDHVWANADELRQVFLNLLLNSADAIASGKRETPGRIDISTENQTDISPHDNSWFTISFSDNGCGIPSESIESIFDPFFTTKEPGKGTGLGLAVSYTIIEQLGGSITAESTVDKGTRITLRLPLFKEIPNSEKFTA
jgi:two-component system NtrC family sensor kinase